MLEKDIENLIVNHPDEVFPGEGYKLIKQQYTIKGKRIDILFEDKLGRKVIVEVKRGILSRNASGQIGEYYGLLKEESKGDNFELILVANIVPPERRRFLEGFGVSCVEIGTKKLQDLAEKYKYTFIEDGPSYPGRGKPKSKDAEIEDEKDEGISVWIF